MADQLQNPIYQYHEPRVQSMNRLLADFSDPDDESEDEEADLAHYLLDREAARRHYMDLPTRPDIANLTPLQQSWTQQQCVGNIVEVFPDVSRKHTSELYTKLSFQFADGALCQAMIEEIMTDAKYPKERDERQTQLRKTEERKKAMQDHKYYRKTSQFILGGAFPNASSDLIKTTLLNEKTVTKAHAVLSGPDVAAARPSKRRKKDGDQREKANATCPAELVDFVLKELLEAQSGHVPSVQSHTAPMNWTVDLTVQMVECPCCYDDVPSNQTAFCDGAESHSFCLNCVRRVVETEIEYRRSRPSCMSSDDCGGGFAEHQLRLALDPKTMNHLLRLRQQQDLKDSDIEGMTECPFCDYMEPCRPVDVDKEFRCKNEDCLRTSCRLCEKDTHLPLTCAQAEKDRKLDARHMLEEAMTSALVRRCNVEACKTQFVKSDGCNSMHCPKCQNHQCYVCGENIKGYNHFAKGKCQTHDGPGGLEALHQADVKKAEEAAKARIRADRPDITEEELQIKVSDAVKQAEARTTAAAAADPLNRCQAMLGRADGHRMHRLLARNREEAARAASPRAEAPVDPYVPGAHGYGNHAGDLLNDFDLAQQRIQDHMQDRADDYHMNFVFNRPAQFPLRQPPPTMPDSNAQGQFQQTALQQLRQRRMMQTRMEQQVQGQQAQERQRLQAWMEQMRQYQRGVDDFRPIQMHNGQAQTAEHTRSNRLLDPGDLQKRLRLFQDEETARFRLQGRRAAEAAAEDLLAPHPRLPPPARAIDPLRAGFPAQPAPFPARPALLNDFANSSAAKALPLPLAPTTADRPRPQRLGGGDSNEPTILGGRAAAPSSADHDRLEIDPEGRAAYDFMDRLDALPRPAPPTFDYTANMARLNAERAALTREMLAVGGRINQPRPVEHVNNAAAVIVDGERTARRREMHAPSYGGNDPGGAQAQQPRRVEQAINLTQSHTAHQEAEKAARRREIRERLQRERTAFGAPTQQPRPIGPIDAVAAAAAAVIDQRNVRNATRPAGHIVDLTADSSDIVDEEDNGIPAEDSDDDELEVLSVHDEREREEIDLTADDEEMEDDEDFVEANQFPASPAPDPKHDAPEDEAIINLVDEPDESYDHTSDASTFDEENPDLGNIDPMQYGMANADMELYGGYDINGLPQPVNQNFAYHGVPIQQMTYDPFGVPQQQLFHYYQPFDQQQAYNGHGNYGGGNYMDHHFGGDPMDPFWW